MAAEARERRPGGETVITRLADVLVIHAIRGWIEQDSAAQSGWLAALRDRQIGRALTLIHRDPARPWTLGLLASEVAMSRSAFAARFSELVGLPAMQYVARWRMHLATTWLRDNDTGLGELASRFGYRSEAAFSRAFKRVVGMSPGAAGCRESVSVTGASRRAVPPFSSGSWRGSASMPGRLPGRFRLIRPIVVPTGPPRRARRAELVSADS